MTSPEITGPNLRPLGNARNRRGDYNYDSEGNFESGSDSDGESDSEGGTKSDNNIERQHNNIEVIMIVKVTNNE